MNTPPLTDGVRLTMAGLLALLVVASAGTWWLRDTSTNGTFINGVKRNRLNAPRLT